MLYNQEFLQQLDECRTKTVYARIIALTLDELPLETIEGRVTQGSVNIDGDSAVRRTCSLTMVAKDYDYNTFTWGLNTKFKLEIGLENTIDPNYPDIIWFKQGTYFISQFSTAQSTNNFTINIQGKDKMCALNGEIGGTLTSSVDFGTVEDILPSGVTQITKLPIKDIIRNVVHLYGGEPLHNIIINDLDISGLELLEYRYEQPMYLYRKTEKGSAFDNVTLDGKKECQIENPAANENSSETDKWLSFIDKGGTKYTSEVDGIITRKICLSDLTSNELEILVNPMTGNKEPSVIQIDGNPYYIAKVSYGETAGYRFTDLTYPGDLIGGVGESITAILDKIKNMLGGYEYFYDLDGQFIFQKKKSRINGAWSPAGTDSEGNTTISFDNDVAYTFKDGMLVTTFNNNPNLGNLKNDYSVWGERKGISGKSIPVHMRYAIDQKPTKYTTVGRKTANGDDANVTYETDDYDWRELIYQMAKDYYANTNNDDFAYLLAAANPEHCVSGKTGYENYYQDILGFWRDLYDPVMKDINITDLENSINTLTSETLPDKKEKVTEAEENLQTALDGLNNAKTAIDKLKWNVKVADAKGILSAAEADYEKTAQELKSQKELLAKCDIYYYGNHNQAGWNTTVYEAPQNLNFWFDFLDTDGELSQYSAKNIGCRPKAINDSSVKAIYFRETPNIVFTKNLEEDSKNSSGYTYVQINEQMMKTMFTISAQGKSAKMAIDDLLYKHSYCIETTTINTIPIYYLEPNSCIHVIDEATGLNGYYNVSKLSIPLTYNGTMSITATKAAQNI